jgi:DNA invertase Pin-like site-specific DNA recombinase
VNTDVPKRVALYARVSTKDKGQDPETQFFPLRDFARDHHFEIIGEYVDVGISGSKERRPQLDRLMEHARKGKFDAVVVARFDRFARSVSHLLKALEEFNQLKIDFISLAENVDTSSPMGRAIFTILGAVAELERNLIRERVLAGMDRARRQGKRFGRPRALVDEVKVCERLEAGESLRAIARDTGIARGTLRNIVQRRGGKKGLTRVVKTPSSDCKQTS